MTDHIDRMMEFSLEIRSDDIPQHVLSDAALAFANIAGVTIGGLQTDTARVALDTISELGGNKQAHVFSTPLQSSIDRVAFVTATAAHVLDYDDTHLPTIYHPTAALFGALMAVSEWKQLSGDQFRECWVVGVELGIRTALALGTDHYDAGWHITATAGAVASAVAAGRAIGLGADQLRHCVGIASACASGHRAHFGTMTKSGQVGNVASAGVHAAVLASHGFTSAPNGLSGRRGLLEAAAPKGDPAALSEGLGSEWLLPDNRLKPYASGVVTHPIIDLGIAARQAGVDAGAIRSIRLLVHPLVVELTGNPSPASGLEGKFSAAHCFSAGLILGNGGPRAFSNQAVNEPDIADLRTKCELVVDPERIHMTAAAQIELADSLRTFEVTDCRGGPTRPMTEEEVREKFIDVTTSTGPLTIAEAHSWFNRLQSVAQEPSMRSLVVDAQALTQSAT